MAIDLKIPNKVEFLQKEFFLLKYTEITKIMLHSEWCPSDQNFRDGFLMPRNTLMWHQFTPTSRWKLQLHHEVSILVRYTLDLLPPVAVTTRINTFLLGDSAIPIYYKSSFATGIMGGGVDPSYTGPAVK